MLDNEFFRRNPDAKKFFQLLLQELDKRQRPSNEIVLSDEEVQGMLKISKRTLQYLKSDGVLTPRKLYEGSTRSYYLLSDILDHLK